MTFGIKSLELGKSYTFNVIAEDGVNHFAAKLNLSPEAIILKVMGERHEGRDFSSGWGEIDQLTCRDLNSTFLLQKLRLVSGSSRMIPHSNRSIGFFENVYEVDHVIFSPDSICQAAIVLSLSIHSEAINKWVGNTEKQEEIIRSYHNKEPIFDSPEKLTEFGQRIPNYGGVYVGYNLSMHSSSPEFSSGISFPPSISLVFENPIGINASYYKYIEIYSLLALFNGNDFAVDLIEVRFGSSSFSQAGTIYFPTTNNIPRHDQGYSLFPLGKNIRFDSLGLPELPLDSFNNYFSLPDKKRGYFKKLLRYQRMDNPEERFLGFFRILESLCFKKKFFLDEDLLEDLSKRIKPYLIKRFGDKKSVTSFLKGIPRYNGSKYNTEKCIQDFYVKVPVEISKNWKFQKSDIGSICSLRNDITHANDYYVSEYEIEEKSKFVEVLLILALFESINIELPVSSRIINRLSGYHLVTKNVA